jgi:lipopolysaccharide biosynthesis glycosyltransferase
MQYDKSILYCISGNYIDVLVTSIRSLLLNNPNQNFQIFVFHNYNERNQEILIQEIRSIKISTFILETFFVEVDFDSENLPLHGHIDVSTYYRLLIEKYIPPTVDKILYLDADVVIEGSIDELFNLDLNGNVLGAVNHNLAISNSDLKLESRFDKLSLNLSSYFNAGVMLIDYKLWLKSNVLARSKSILHQYSAHLDWWDQDILNMIFINSYLSISPKWNFIDKYYSAKEDLTRIIIIYHFAGPHKPWYLFVKVPNKEVFWKYYNLNIYFSHLNFKRFIQNFRMYVIQIKNRLIH